MGSFSKNYEIINLTPSGTTSAGILGNGITANTVHQIMCLTSGVNSISITAMGGGTFTWAPSLNDVIEVVPSTVVITSGTFIGFRVKNMGISYTTNTYNG